MIKVKRALLSVSDKTGLADFAKGLHALGIEMLSTGGTAQSLRAAGLSVKDVSEYTGSAEILDGRVKTLHPKIYAGLLARRDDAGHLQQLEEGNILLIDLVVVNLYPFAKVIQKKNVSLDEAVENIDIGGPSLLRAAAKNYRSVAAVCNPQKYADILKELEHNSGLLSDAVLLNLAMEAFEHTAQYDQMIFSYFQSLMTGSDGFSSLPKELFLKYQKVQDLRYGENPHQAGAFYRNQGRDGGLPLIQQRHGKELSFNNLLDLNAALAVVNDFAQPAAVVIKHSNPTGVAVGDTLKSAFKDALSCDKISAFGGIIGLNQTVDRETAEAISASGFMESVVAPGYQETAFKILAKKKNLRIMQIKLDAFSVNKFDFKLVEGGLLLQEADRNLLNMNDVKIVTSRKLTKIQEESIQFGWKVVRHVRSNAVILVKGRKTVGIGCGQTSRIESTQAALQKAGKRAAGALMISDAFLPKVDNVTVAAKAGVKIIVQTGGSIVDEKVIRAAEKAKIVMMMTGVRHFKH